MLSLFFVVIGSLPYLYGYWVASPESVFMGLVGKGAANGQGYLMFARQVQDGHHLLQNRLTPEPLPQSYFSLEWWIFGQFARWTGLSLMATFHVGRAVGVFMFVFGAYYLAAQCLATRFQRRLSLALIVFSAGLGWLPYLASYALDTIYPNAVSLPVQWVGGLPFPSTVFPLARDLAGINIFGYLTNNPHFIRSGALAILKYAFLIKGERTGQTRYFALCGVFAFCEAHFRPYAMPETYLVLAIFGLLCAMKEGRLSRQRVFNYGLAGALLAPAVLYYAWIMFGNVLGVSGWERPSQFLGGYFAWFGIPMILAFLGFLGIAHYRRMRMPSILLMIWILVALMISQAYPLINYGDESAFYTFAVAPHILIVAGILRQMARSIRRSRIASWLHFDLRSRRTKQRAAIALVAICSISSPIVYARMFTLLQSLSPPFYLPVDLVQSFEWLDRNAGTGDVILANPEISPFIVRCTDGRACTGHDMITTDFEHKNAMVHRFFATAGDDEFKRGMIDTFRVKYILVSPGDVGAGRFQPADHPWLAKVFEAGNAAVYVVRAVAE